MRAGPRARAGPPAAHANDNTPPSMSSSTAPSRRFRSKTLTAALAFLFGSLGAHRFYLYGFRDVFGWAHLLATIVGIPGFLLLAATQRSAGLGWWLAVPGAISLLAAFLAALVYGLRPDENGTCNSTRRRASTASRAGP